MADSVSFTIPAPPSVNNLFANVAGKGRVRTERYRVWLNAAGWSIIAAQAGGGIFPKLLGEVCVAITNGNTRQDIDNCAKGILDLLVEMGVIGDDRQVAELRITRGGKAREATVTVTAL